MNALTRILSAIEQGESQATDELLPLVYGELRLLAAQKLSQERPGQTLQPTALVHEAYLRLLGPEVKNWKSRAHFFGAAAEAMRRILVEKARRKQRLKHGGAHRRIDMEKIDAADQQSSEQMLALDEALTRLTQEDPLKAELVKLRYFAGLSMRDATALLGISKATADRYWSYARAWLFHEINPD